MARYVESGRATKGVLRKTGRLVESYRKKTPQEKAKAAKVIEKIKRHGPTALAMFVPGGGVTRAAGIGVKAASMLDISRKPAAEKKAVSTKPKRRRGY